MITIPAEEPAPIAPEERIVRIAKQTAAVIGVLLLIAAVAVWKWIGARKRRARIAAAT